MQKLVRNIFLYIIVMSFAFSSIAINVGASEVVAPFSGAGTSESPYLIGTSADLVKLAELTNVVGSEYVSKYYKITADIDMTGVEFDGICEEETAGINGRDPSKPPFSGTIDGDYHIIRNLTIDRSDNWYGSSGGAYAGLVSWANTGAVIKNLGLVNASIKAYSGAGGFVGRTTGAITLENCFVRGITLASNTNNNGALIREDAGSTIRNCYSTGVVGEGSHTGIVATGTPALIKNVYSTDGLGASGTNLLRIGASTTAEQIASFIESSEGAFKVDEEELNDGNPVLAWERAIELPPPSNDVFENGVGDGSEESPYEISTAEDLVKLSELTNVVNSAYADKHYKLICDIDMAGVQFGGICKQDADDSSTRDGTKPLFTGIIDGNGYVIKNFVIDRSDGWYGTNGGYYAGLVSWAGAGAVIKNLGMEKVTSNAYSGAGAFIGRCLGAATIENCYVKDVTLSSFNEYSTAGILAEGTAGVLVKNCYALSVAGGMGSIGHGTSGATSGTVENFYCSGANVRFKMDDVTNGYRWDSLSADTEAQRTAFIAAGGGAFKVDANKINGGYPVLKWQTERISENGNLIILETNIINSDKVEFGIKNCNTSPLSASIAVIAYGENNKMLAAKIYEEKELESGDKFYDKFSYAGAGDVVLVKVILWNSLSGQKLYDYADIQIPIE